MWGGGNENVIPHSHPQPEAVHFILPPQNSPGLIQGIFFPAQARYMFWMLWHYQLGLSRAPALVAEPQEIATDLAASAVGFGGHAFHLLHH